MNDTKKLALLIDSDNVSPKYSQFILQEASKHGDLIYKRIYGDWEKNNSGWRIPAMNNSIMPVQQNSYIAGKNATDFSMIIDAMDILYTGKVDGFVLVTSDSDFTRLAIRLRESGMLVIGIGEVKTPLAFTSSCHSFSYLNQVCDNLGEYDETILRKAVVDYVKDNDDGKLDLSKINAYLNSRYGNIDYDALGYNRLSMFLDSIPEIVRKGTFVMMKKSAAAPKALPVNVPDEKEITRVIVEYLNRQNGGQADISKVSNYVNQVLGKIDFSRFGSKKFAKFVDKQSVLVRQNTSVSLAANAKAKPAADPEAKPAAKPAEEPKLKAKAPIHITSMLFEMEVRKYASENGEKGGNLGQLNNMLLEKYGKNYIADLGASDFAAAMNSVSGIKIEKNFVKIGEKASEKRVQKSMAAKNAADTSAKKSETKTETAPQKKQTAEELKQESAPEAAPKKRVGRPKKEITKPDINIIKRDIFELVTQQDNAAPLTAAGNLLVRKYGKGYLKDLGFTTLKKLLAEIKGVSVKNDVVSLNKSFIKRTEEIERFIYNFARNDEKKSIKSLSMQLRGKYKNFDFTDYGYTKFSDFINAIDGVRANGYYVEPIE